MKFDDTIEIRRSRCDVSQLPIVISFSQDGRLEKAGTVYSTNLPLMVGPLLRLSEYDFVVPQMWPIYRYQPSTFEASTYCQRLAVEVIAQLKKTGATHGFIIDIVASNVDSVDSDLQIMAFSREDGGAYVEGHFARHGYRIGPRLSARDRFQVELLELAVRNPQIEVLQLSINPKCILDQVTDSPIHLTKLQSCLREFLYSATGYLKCLTPD